MTLEDGNRVLTESGYATFEGRPLIPVYGGNKKLSTTMTAVLCESGVTRFVACNRAQSEDEFRAALDAGHAELLKLVSEQKKQGE